MSAAPSWLIVAREQLGVKELPGPATNPRIAEYLKSVHLHPEDEIPWCSAFVNWCIEKVAIDGTDRGNARSWLDWGTPCGPQLGAVCILWRESRLGSKGHVGFFERAEGASVVLLGGNQGNQVCSAPYGSNRVLGYRWPKGVAFPE